MQLSSPDLYKRPHSYLTIYIYHKTCFSQWYRVDSGIPQGTILGPLLFLIYINDLPNVTQNTDTRIFLYADDAKIYRCITCVEDSQCLQRVIDKVKQWCDEWLLPLNVSKCNVMSFTSKTNLDTSYCIRNKDSKHTIRKVDSIKDLGILFDTRLNFKDHIQEKN